MLSFDSRKRFFLILLGHNFKDFIDLGIGVRSLRDSSRIKLPRCIDKYRINGGISLIFHLIY
jgi:hypothetical protein